MGTESKLRKKSFTIVEQAIHEIRGFRNLYQELDDKVRLSGQSPGAFSGKATFGVHLQATHYQRAWQNQIRIHPPEQIMKKQGLEKAGQILFTNTYILHFAFRVFI